VCVLGAYNILEYYIPYAYIFIDDDEHTHNTHIIIINIIIIKYNIINKPTYAYNINYSIIVDCCSGALDKTNNNMIIYIIRIILCTACLREGRVCSNHWSHYWYIIILDSGYNKG